MINKNDSRFLSPWGQRLAELGLDVRDVNVGRYVQIDLSQPRIEPEEFAEFGEFDTFVVLNPQVIPKGCTLWIYFNNKRPESRLPLHHISRMETVADRFYLQHNGSWEGVTLEIILGGDLRALSVEPNDKGVIRVEGNALDITDRPERELGHVTAEVTGEIEVTDGATETTLGQVKALLESLGQTDFATQATLETARGLLESLEGKDFATENTLSVLAGRDFATEAKLEAVRVILASLEGKDFATENTLSVLAGRDFATEAKLEAVRAILASLEGKDFATENTLSTLAGKDFATETKLEAVRDILASLEGKDFATENTLSTLAGKDFATETTLTLILQELQNQTAILEQIAINTTPDP